ncbi:hypothetical protein FQA39_LY16698 [Lamprigera yunnana]|nr:hypothetical protein FQA39_LY16698 [Lamprigera yunnana]
MRNLGPNMWQQKINMLLIQIHLAHFEYKLLMKIKHTKLKERHAGDKKEEKVISYVNADESTDDEYNTTIPMPPRISHSVMEEDSTSISSVEPGQLYNMLANSLNSLSIIEDELRLSCSTYEDFQNLNVKLEDAQVKAAVVLIRLLRRCIALTPEKTTTAMLQAVFSYNVAVECNWEGRGDKQGIKDIPVVKLMQCKLTLLGVARTSKQTFFA